jgi:hypothetical protein
MLLEMFSFEIGGRGCESGYRAWVRCKECKCGNLYDAGSDECEFRRPNYFDFKNIEHSKGCKNKRRLSNRSNIQKFSKEVKRFKVSIL